MDDNQRYATRLYFNLLKNGEIKKSTNKELYNLYSNNKDVQENLYCMVEEESKSHLIITPEAIYLIPTPDNEIIGFNYRNDEEFRTVESQMEYYLGLYIITVIFNEFFNKVSPVEFISIDELVKRIGKRLEIASVKENIKEIENNISFNIIALKEAWGAKASVPEHKDDESGKFTRQLKYKYGFVRKIIIFLVNQELIIYHKEDDEIRPRQKLTDLMNYYFLDNDRKKLIDTYLFNVQEGEK